MNGPDLLGLLRCDRDLQQLAARRSTGHCRRGGSRATCEEGHLTLPRSSVRGRCCDRIDHHGFLGMAPTSPLNS